MKILSKKLKEVRTNLGITQKEFAEELGIPLKTYKNYETIGIGNVIPPMPLLIKMSELLEVSLDWIAGKD